MIEYRLTEDRPGKYRLLPEKVCISEFLNSFYGEQFRKHPDQLSELLNLYLKETIGNIENINLEVLKTGVRETQKLILN